MRFPAFFLFFFSWSALFSQPATRHYDAIDPGNEQISVQLNSTFLLTGETLYFKIFCQLQKNKAPTMLSKVAYLELVDELGTPVFQTIIPLQKGSGYGDLFIPSAFSSGNYTLIAYTRWMKNFTTDSFFTKRITIINPFKGSVAAPTGMNTKLQAENRAIASRSNSIELSLSGTTFRTREKVTVALAARDVAGVCISVRKRDASLDESASKGEGTDQRRLDSTHTDVVSLSPFSSQKELPSSMRTKTFLAEMRGHLIMGTLKPKGEAAATKTILAAIPGPNFVFRAVPTDQHGKFAIIINNIPESSAMLLQVLEDDIKNYTVEIEDPFLGDYTNFRQEPLSIDTSLLAIIDERNIYTQIENAYYEAKRDSQPPTSSSHFYNLPDKIYKLDDFTRFPTMEDIFREYIPEVMVRLSRENFSLHVVNALSGYPYTREPLMLIDGVPIMNTNTLMAYDPLKVERIEIVTAKYVYGALEADGIISMKTYKGEVDELPSFNSHRVDVVGIRPGKAYYFPDYSVDKLKLERTPDYRLQLYWNPSVTLTKDHGTMVEFYTSDVTGEFEIVVEAFTGDGKLAAVREVFSVLK